MIIFKAAIPILVGAACTQRKIGKVLLRMYAKLLITRSAVLAQNAPQAVWRPGSVLNWKSCTKGVGPWEEEKAG